MSSKRQKQRLEGRHTDPSSRNMAIILKDFNHVTVVQGELVPSGNSFDLEDLLGNFDYKRIIKMQFDRLDPSFQEFLTVRQIYLFIFLFLKNPLMFHLSFRLPHVWINSSLCMRLGQ